MDVLHLQGLMGHSTLEMTRHYIDLLEEDLAKAHREYGPIDTILRRTK
jgi:integrase/recombinase XerD